MGADCFYHTQITTQKTMTMTGKKISALKIETDGVESSTCIKDTDIKSVVFLLLGYKAEQAPMERKDA